MEIIINIKVGIWWEVIEIKFLIFSGCVILILEHDYVFIQNKIFQPLNTIIRLDVCFIIIYYLLSFIIEGYWVGCLVVFFGLFLF